MKVILFSILLIGVFTEIFTRRHEGYLKLGRARTKRETHAGYTKDPDKCQIYNHNLKKMWKILSKHLNSTDDVDVNALHNIAVMIEAYLGHKNSHGLKSYEVKNEKKRDKISKLLRKIKKLLGKENATKEIYDMVLEHFKPNYDEDECKEINENNLRTSIALSYKNYLENSKCRGDYDTGLLRGKALLRGGRQPDIEVSLNSDNQDFYNYQNNDEVASFNDNKSPNLNKRNAPNDIPSRRTEYRRRSKRHMSFLRSKRYLSKRGRNRSNLQRMSYIRTDESCVKYANRKFLITLRTSIERFMDLRDCQSDDTLRTSHPKIHQRRKSKKTMAENTGRIKRIKEKHNVIAENIYDNGPGLKGQNRVHDYLSNVKDYEITNPSNAANHKDLKHSHKIRLLNVNKPPDIARPKMMLLLQYPAANVGTTYYPYYYNRRTKHKLNSVYKLLIDSSNNKLTKKIVLHRKPTSTALFKINQEDASDGNLYNTIQKKIRQPYKFVVTPPQKVPQNDYVTADLPYSDYNEKFNADDLFKSYNINDFYNNLLRSQIKMASLSPQNNKGYVELSYLVKYPIPYRPQYLLKNVIQYDDFVKMGSQIYNTDSDRQLVKIVRHLPDKTSQVLFETQGLKSSQEIYYVGDNEKVHTFYNEHTSTGDVPITKHSTLKTDSEINLGFNKTQTLSNDLLVQSSYLNSAQVKRKEDDSYLNKTRHTTGVDQYSLDSAIDGLNVILKFKNKTNYSVINQPSNTTKLRRRSDDKESEIDERILEILNASLNTGEFIKTADKKSIPANKDGNNIDAKSISDYLRFNLTGGGNLRAATQVFLKELEAQGLSVKSLTKSMLRTWWELLKNKHGSSKVKAITERLSSLLKEFKRLSKFITLTPYPKKKTIEVDTDVQEVEPLSEE